MWLQGRGGEGVGGGVVGIICVSFNIYIYLSWVVVVVTSVLLLLYTCFGWNLRERDFRCRIAIG